MATEQPGWRVRLLRLMARGELEFAGRPVSMRITSEVIRRILADSELDRQLDELDEDELLRAFLRLYAEAAPRLGGTTNGD